MTTGVHEVGTGTEVRAYHVMPGMEGPEGQLHAHDYRLEVVIERPELDARGMVCDLDVLDAALTHVADQVRDADLDVIRPEGAEAVTVEVFARWVHQALAESVRVAGGAAGAGAGGRNDIVLSVRVWESPVAFGGYKAPV